MKLRNNLWLLPFLSFLGGYLIFRAFNKTEYVQVPALVGLSLQKACTRATQTRLTIHLVAEKEDLDLPESTVISQTPAASARLKPHQSIFLVVSKKPSKACAPDLRGTTLDDARKTLQELSIRSKVYSLETNYPHNQCFGQTPGPDEALNEAKMLLYVSTGDEKPVIMPNYKNKHVLEVLDYLHTNSIKVKITHDQPIAGDHHCDNCIISDQRPLPGSLVTFNKEKPLIINLQVAAQ